MVMEEARVAKVKKAKKARKVARRRAKRRSKQCDMIYDDDKTVHQVYIDVQNHGIFCLKIVVCNCNTVCDIINSCYFL